MGTKGGQAAKTTAKNILPSQSLENSSLFQQILDNVMAPKTALGPRHCCWFLCHCLSHKLDTAVIAAICRINSLPPFSFASLASLCKGRQPKTTSVLNLILIYQATKYMVHGVCSVQPAQPDRSNLSLCDKSSKAAKPLVSRTR